MRGKNSHYFIDVTGLQFVDIYRVCELYGVGGGPIEHAIKKLMCAGKRGAKDKAKDIQEAIDQLERWKQMRDEDDRGAMIRKAVESGDIVLEFGEPVFVGRLGEVTMPDPLACAGCANGCFRCCAHVPEPASEIDEERSIVVASSHGDGEHYAFVCGVCHHMTKQGVRHICQ